MCGSFNNYARRVRTVDLPIAARAGALRSCIRVFCENVPQRPYISVVRQMGRLVGTDLAHSAEERHLLDALSRLERVRQQILELRRAFERRRIRQKLRGRRVPDQAEERVFQEAILRLCRAAEILPTPVQEHPEA